MIVGNRHVVKVLHSHLAMDILAISNAKHAFVILEEVLHKSHQFVVQVPNAALICIPFNVLFKFH
jgi:hypothetical protein